MHWVVCSGGELRSVLVLKRHLLLLLWSLAAFGADDQAIQTSHTGGQQRNALRRIHDKIFGSRVLASSLYSVFPLQILKKWLKHRYTKLAADHGFSSTSAGIEPVSSPVMSSNPPGVSCTISAFICTSRTVCVQQNAAIRLVVYQSAEILGLIICFAIHFLCVKME